MTTEEVADRLRLAPSTVRRIDPAHLPRHVVGVRGVLRFRQSEVAAYLARSRRSDPLLDAQVRILERR